MEQELHDEVIVCKDCGKEFTFTVRDQLFYQEQGFEHKPVRCKECRQKRKAEREQRAQTTTTEETVNE